MATNTITLASDGLGPELDEGVEHAEAERGDHRAPQLAEAADHDDQERVDDVVGAERRADRAEQGERHPGDAGQAGADEERRAVDPVGGDARAGGELAVLHDRPHPPPGRQPGEEQPDAGQADRRPGR